MYRGVNIFPRNTYLVRDMSRTKTPNRRRISQKKTNQEKRREVNTIPNRSLALAQEDAVTTRRAEEKEYTSAPTQRKASLPPHLLLLFLSLTSSPSPAHQSPSPPPLPPSDVLPLIVAYVVEPPLFLPSSVSSQRCFLLLLLRPSTSYVLITPAPPSSSVLYSQQKSMPACS